MRAQLVKSCSPRYVRNGNSVGVRRSSNGRRYYNANQIEHELLIP